MSGHAIQVTVKQLGGGTVKELYYVAKPDAAAAEMLLRDALGLTDEDVNIVAGLSDKEIEGLGIAPGGWARAN